MDSDIQTPEMSHTTVLFVLQIICYLGAVFFLLSFSVSLLCGWFSCSTTSCPPGGAVWSRGAEWVRASGGRGGRGRAGHGARAGRGNRFGGRIWMTASWHCFILFFASCQTLPSVMSFSTNGASLDDKIHVVVFFAVFFFSHNATSATNLTVVLKEFEPSLLCSTKC